MFSRTNNYGALFWWKATNKNVSKRNFIDVQSLAVFGIPGVMRNTPYAAPEAVLNLHVLVMFFKRLAAKGLLKNKNNNGNSRYGETQIFTVTFATNGYLE